jgi:L-lactate dehydrogenase complex protein LldG
MRIYSRFARSPRLFTVSQKLAALGTRLVSPFGDWIRLPASTGWGYSKDFPRFAVKPFRDRFTDLEPEEHPVTQTDQHLSNEGENTGGPASQDRDNLVSTFTEELTKVNGSVIQSSTSDLTGQIIQLLHSRGIGAMHLEPNLLDEAALEKAGITVSRVPDPALRVGVTKAICGLADTGSILIADGVGDPLQASLLPEIHIAVLCASDIFASLANAINLPMVRGSRAAVVITGPSRTADIEMSLTIGMHGPGEVMVFLVHSSASRLVDD